MKKYLVILFLLLCISAQGRDWVSQSNEALRSDMLTFAEGFAQREKGTPAGKILRSFVKKQKRYGDKDSLAWISDTKDVVLKLEKICPPVVDDGSHAAQTRRDMFLLLDYPLHADNRAPGASEALKDEFDRMSDSYRAQAREKVLKFLETQAPAKPGELQIIKVYNCGIILRDSERTIAIDIKWEGDSEGAEAIASKADVFYLSHPHHDHYNDIMMEALADEGVETVLSEDVAPSRQWDGKMLIHEDVYEPVMVNGIKTVIQKGYQKKAPNNLYYLEFDGWKVLLPGESHNFEKLSELSQLEAPDLILVPSWNRMDLVFEAVSKMKGFDRTKVICIPEHENEFTHTVDHRESFRELFSRKDRLGGDDDAVRPEILLLEIGENATLKK